MPQDGVMSSEQSIRYEMQMPDGHCFSFTVHPDRPPELSERDAPAWAALSFQRCPRCPMSDDTPLCPPAASLAKVIDSFQNVASYDRAEVTVHTAHRTISRDCDVQSALGSLFGLMMAASGCPVLTPLRGLAIHHLPFATPRETLYRTAAHYFLGQFFVHQRTGASQPSLEGLRTLYTDLQSLNRSFADRIRQAASRDAHLNALVMLFSLSAIVQLSLESELEELEHLFG